MTLVGLSMNFSAAALCLILIAKGFQHLTFVVHSASKTARFAVYANIHLVQMPSPLRVLAHCVDPLSADLVGEHRAKAPPPKPHGFMADRCRAHAAGPPHCAAAAVI